MNSELIEILKTIFTVALIPASFVVAFIGYFISKSELEIDDEVSEICTFIIKISGYAMWPCSIIMIITFFQNI